MEHVPKVVHFLLDVDMFWQRRCVFAIFALVIGFMIAFGWKIRERIAVSD